MAELLKRENNLTALKLSVDRSESSMRGYVVFTVEHGRNKVGSVRAGTAEIGLPSDLRAVRKMRYSEPKYVIPEAVIGQIKEMVSGELDPGAPLWLHFVSASDYLSLQPWERMLRPALDVPILRLPYFYLEPFARGDTLTIVVCASSPLAKGTIPIPVLLQSIVYRLQEAVQRPTIIHLFVDASHYDTLRNMLADRLTAQGQNRVILHDPKEAVAYSPSERSNDLRNLSGHMESPWLRWMKDALAENTADVVHFVCHGYLSLEEGALAFAESPNLNEDRSVARFVGPQHLCAFLNRVGAWSVGFSSPQSNYSTPGLRLLADQVARSRPGPVFFHDCAIDPEAAELAPMYRFLYNREPQEAPICKATAFYTHPGRVIGMERDEEDDYRSSKLQYTLASGAASQLLESKESTPSWLVSGQRYLEQSVAQLSTEYSMSASEKSATEEGIEEALSFVSDVLGRHALQSDPREPATTAGAVAKDDAVGASGASGASGAAGSSAEEGKK